MSLALRILALLVVAAACQAVGPVHEQPLTKNSLVAAVPWRNLTGDPGAAADLQRLFKAELTDRGVAFVPSSELEHLLAARRIRYTDSLSDAALAAILEESGASQVMLGTLLSYEAGSDPVVSVAARVLAGPAARRLRSSVVTLRGSDFEGLLGLGAITDPADLLAEAVIRLVDDLTGEPGSEAAPGLPLAAVSTVYRRELTGFEPDERLVVLAMTNRTEDPNAGSLFAELLAHQAFRVSGMQVVERSELIAALVREEVRMMDLVDLDLLTRVGRALRCRLFVLGSLDRYDRHVYVESQNLPEVQATVRILDVETGRIMAAAATRRRGDDYHLVLGLGTVRDPIALANQVARELMDALGG